MANRKIEKIIGGLAVLLLGCFIMIYTVRSGSFYSKMVLNRANNTVHVGGLFSSDKLMRLGEVMDFKTKPSYQKNIFSLMGNICYNLEITKKNEEKIEVFPFCLSNQAKIKSIEKEADAFLQKQGLHNLSVSVFSFMNAAWLLIGFFIALIGYVLTRSALRL